MFLERFNPTIIEERRLATKEFLNFAVKHLYLRTHDAYISFFQVIVIDRSLSICILLLIMKQFRTVKKLYYLMWKQIH